MISEKALSLGSVVRDPPGFESAKWHRVDCFPFTSGPIDSAESIQGFSSLEEALKKLVVECKNSTEEVQVTDEDREREDDGLHGSKKIAAFDFDGCLVNTWVKRSNESSLFIPFPVSLPN